MTETKNYSFFQHRTCEYFPCHKGVPDKDFNCLFCFCPLYVLGQKCGGNCQYTEAGYKDCSKCAFPHHREHYDVIIARYEEIMKLTRKTDAEG